MAHNLNELYYILTLGSKIKKSRQQKSLILDVFIIILEGNFTKGHANRSNNALIEFIYQYKTIKSPKATISIMVDLLVKQLPAG